MLMYKIDRWWMEPRGGGGVHKLYTRKLPTIILMKISGHV